MSLNLTNARPYAKAIFNLALVHDKVAVWHDTLELFSLIVEDSKEYGILDTPLLTVQEKNRFFAPVTVKFPEAVNLIKLLVVRKKLSLLPDIYSGYQRLFFAHNNILEVRVESKEELLSEQKEQLICALEATYHSKILLQVSYDASLIGGGVIYIADKVIDCSIKGFLERLRKKLMV